MGAFAEEDKMTELHNFEDMIAHLEAGGYAHRF